MTQLQIENAHLERNQLPPGVTPAHIKELEDTVVKLTADLKNVQEQLKEQEQVMSDLKVTNMHLIMRNLAFA